MEFGYQPSQELQKAFVWETQPDGKLEATAFRCHISIKAHESDWPTAVDGRGWIYHYRTPRSHGFGICPTQEEAQQESIKTLAYSLSL